LLALAGLFAPWLASQPPDRQEDVAGARLLPPLTRAHLLHRDDQRTWIVTDLEERNAEFHFRRGGAPASLPAHRLTAPPAARLYLLGTDGLGRDLASRLLFGLRHALIIGGLSTLVALILGIGIGATAGLAGGFSDAIIMRSVDVVLALPRILVYLVVATLVPPSALALVLILGGTSWTELARLVRAELLTLRRSELAAAAHAVGATPARTLTRHLLPQLAPVVAVTLALRFADVVLLEAALSFLGLGAPPPAVSLGGMLAAGRDLLGQGWWVTLWPGGLIGLLVLALRGAAAGPSGARA
jgi:peptide/nickel transport system permease protein